ncbi:hypothetical protein GCM10010885_06420 [Alicyclobacillus cellulosilyticus]|uniref:Uncharacterized protein n=1 Tax=Alicyclobacillus cellulosilyticus TaxID=1003997 RepID=A0A917K6Z1_9BACL|nr:hypothetical protein [Alicyclobacillus cellulosilyticus]GGI99863.1 hypothetical protein GCM10010885_06420 [Alicyclobacillus cellulosilyticus]
MTAHEIALACIILLPVAFALGRYSTRVTWFHARNEERLTVQEFMRGRQ